MASPELQMVLEMLRGSPLLTGSIRERRASMEAATAAMPVPADVTFEPVHAGGIVAEWAAAPEAAADRVIVYFHGGGYCIGSIKTHRLLVANLSRACGARVLSVDYRLAPEHPFPAAVEDGVAAYRFVRGGVQARHIAIAGDSAGGGLAAATLIALRDAGEALPAAGVCISPWLDLTMSGATMVTKAAVDPMVHQSELQEMADAYLGGADPRTPTASPLFADLHGLPPLLVHVGTAETLLDDARRFSDAARAAGVPLELDVWEDMVHVWHAFAFVLPEGRQAIERIGTYVRARFERGRAGD